MRGAAGPWRTRAVQTFLRDRATASFRAPWRRAAPCPRGAPASCANASEAEAGLLRARGRGAAPVPGHGAGPPRAARVEPSTPREASGALVVASPLP